MTMLVILNSRIIQRCLHLEQPQWQQQEWHVNLLFPWSQPGDMSSPLGSVPTATSGSDLCNVVDGKVGAVSCTGSYALKKAWQRHRSGTSADIEMYMYKNILVSLIWTWRNQKKVNFVQVLPRHSFAPLLAVHTCLNVDIWTCRKPSSGQYLSTLIMLSRGMV